MAVDKTLAEELRRLKLNDLPIVNERFLKLVVKHLLRRILDQGDMPEHMKRNARFCAFLIANALREARNAPNRSLVLNVIWAGLDLGSTSPISVEGVEMFYAEARSKMSSAAGKKSGADRRANRRWTAHAAELAKEAYALDQSASNEKIAESISDNWKLGNPECPGHRTLTKFVSEQRGSGKLPQRTG
jgi:hypothetical protein